MEAISLFAIFLFLIFSGVPLAFSMALTTIIFSLFIAHASYSLEGIFLTFLTGAEAFPLLAVPLFILAGELINTGGIGVRIIRFLTGLVGFLPGGLGLVTVGASMVFAGISGSAVADSSAIGSIMIPGMAQKGYTKRFASALVAAAGTIGVIIPPSIPMVVYAFIANVSLGDLFLAGVVPGIFFGVGMMMICVIIAKRRGYDVGGERAPLNEVIKGMIECLPAFLMPIIILGGIFGGIFTPTEAAAVAVIYGFVVSMFLYKETKWSDLPRIFRESMVTSGTVLLVICSTTALTFIVTSENIPKIITEFLLGLTSEKWVYLIIINVFLLIVGMFVDALSGLLISVPLLMTSAVAFGVDPIHLGIIMVCNLAIGLYTPPVGVCLFVSARIGKVPIGEVVKELIPFFAISLIVMMMVTFIPDMSLWLVRMFSTKV